MARTEAHDFVITPVPVGRPRYRVTRLSYRYNASIKVSELVGYTYAAMHDSIDEALLEAGKRATDRQRKNPKLATARFFVQVDPERIPITYTDKEG